jgi:hypothetical protein
MSFEGRRRRRRRAFGENRPEEQKQGERSARASITGAANLEASGTCGAYTHIVPVVRSARIMRSFKNPSFQDRIGSAAEAKKKALDNLRSKPPPDEKRVAERQAARLRREAAAAAKREARKTADQAAREAKAAGQEAQAAAASELPTEADRKAARDARYAARKGRK